MLGALSPDPRYLTGSNQRFKRDHSPAAAVAQSDFEMPWEKVTLHAFLSRLVAFYIDEPLPVPSARHKPIMIPIIDSGLWMR
jgi:hypothetical protein